MFKSFLMISWLKKYFIPHPDNDHRPHFLRTQATVFILSLVIFVELLFILPVVGIFTHSNYFAEILSSVLVDSANADRLKLSEQGLKVNQTLVAAAQLKANDMANKGYFAHVSPTGVDPWYWFKQAGYKYVRAGENLAVNFSDSKDLHTAWMNSPGHRANIVNANYSEIGIATAKGIYKGQEAVFVVQLFGQPAKPKPVLAVNTTSAQTVPKTTPKVAPKVTPKPTIKPSPTPAKTVEAAADSSHVDFVALAVNDDAPPPVGQPVEHQATFAEKILSEPKTVTDNLFSAMLAAVLVALGLAIFVRIQVQSTRIITNGLIMVIVMLGVIILNQYIGNGNIAANIGGSIL